MLLIIAPKNQVCFAWKREKENQNVDPNTNCTLYSELMIESQLKKKLFSIRQNIFFIVSKHI